MTDILNIAASCYSGSITLFVGSGFSKYMTGNSAPNWLELLGECALSIAPKKHLFKQLFLATSEGEIKRSKIEILVCAQIIEQQFKIRGKSMKDEIATIVNNKVNETTISKTRLAKIQSFFAQNPKINIITTNYDTLFSQHIFPETGRVIVEGDTIPRINNTNNIFHIHGSVTRPDSIVVTLSDYYNFLNSRNYFSRKFYTLLQETTVVILGYSLGDFNLNTILNEVNSTRKDSFRKTNIYYVSIDDLDTMITQFYHDVYGIKYIKTSTLGKFFNDIQKSGQSAKDLIDSVKDLQEVIEGEMEYQDDFIKLRQSLPEIILQAGSLGVEKTEEKFINLLIHLLKKKRSFTRETGAWEQYHHLADWLIEIASTIIIRGTTFEKEFTQLVEYSLRHCSRKQYLGFSWQAYWEWKSRWKEMKLENQIMLQSLIDSTRWGDAEYGIKEIYKGQ